MPSGLLGFHPAIHLAGDRCTLLLRCLHLLLDLVAIGVIRPYQRQQCIGLALSGRRCSSLQYVDVVRHKTTPLNGQCRYGAHFAFRLTCFVDAFTNP